VAELSQARKARWILPEHGDKRKEAHRPTLAACLCFYGKALSRIAEITDSSTSPEEL